MMKEWEVDFTIKGKISFFCASKEDSEKMAHDYLSNLLYPDCCNSSYEIENISEVE